MTINANINSVQIVAETRRNGGGMEVCNKTKRMNFISVDSLRTLNKRLSFFCKQITMKYEDISECAVAGKSISAVNDPT